MNNETAQEIELQIARYFGVRPNIIVPNVSWGMFRDNRECDLVVLRQSGYAYEIEIKVSKSDLRKDRQKWHNHISERLRGLWFAIPEKLKESIDLIPETAGIFIVSKNGFVTEIRKPTINRVARKLNEDERFQLARLGAICIWSLKNRILLFEAERRKLIQKDRG